MINVSGGLVCHDRADRVLASIKALSRVFILSVVITGNDGTARVLGTQTGSELKSDGVVTSLDKRTWIIWIGPLTRGNGQRGHVAIDLVIVRRAILKRDLVARITFVINIRRWAPNPIIVIIQFGL